MKSNYQYAYNIGYDLGNTGTIVVLENRGRRSVTLEAEATGSSTPKFLVEIDMGDGEWAEWETISKQDVARTLDLVSDRVRVVNDTAVAGETADVRIACA